ncbi:WecB/TagA/CpsF family glycosyl transferase [Luteolibacter sp. LG18]|nr:WecB/TagA/CpsF family glycosyl transferase [Luteolibacter sp. LG18]
MEESLGECREMMQASPPSYLVTANVDFTTQASEDPDLRKIVFYADRVVCDGMPLVWLSKWLGSPLRERVAGSDMVPRLLEICASDARSVYFFGSDLKTLQEAAKIAESIYPGLKVVGCEAPPMGAVVEWDNEGICARMKASGASLLLVCLGCPKQERWIFAHHRDTGIPLSIGVGASLDFITGKQKRAPKWMQRVGLEWFWRMAGNPKRLVSRYANDFHFLAGAALRQAMLSAKRDKIDVSRMPAVARTASNVIRLSWVGALEKGSYEGAAVPDQVDRPVLLDASAVSFMDSGGLGRLALLLRRCRASGQELFLVAASGFVRHALAAGKLDTMLTIVPDESTALETIGKTAVCTRTSVDGGIARVAFDHPLDAMHLDEITSALEDAESRAGKSLVVDFSAVPFIDSRAVGVLIRYHKKMLAKGGALYLDRVSGEVSQILKLLRLDAILEKWEAAA